MQMLVLLGASKNECFGAMDFLGGMEWIHRENGEECLGWGPRKINPIYILYSGYFFGYIYIYVSHFPYDEDSWDSCDDLHFFFTSKDSEKAREEI